MAVQEKNDDSLHRLTINVEEASAEESTGILNVLESMSDDELKISTVKKFTV